MKTNAVIAKTGRVPEARAARGLTAAELERVEGGIKDVLCTHELTRLPSGQGIPTPWDLAPPHEPYPTHGSPAPF